jgi:hypothetical protein
MDGMTPNQSGLVIADRFISGEYTGRDNLALHISSAINQAMADERERCAKIVDEWPVLPDGAGPIYRAEIAAAIRKGEAVSR